MIRPTEHSGGTLIDMYDVIDFIEDHWQKLLAVVGVALIAVIAVMQVMAFHASETAYSVVCGKESSIYGKGSVARLVTGDDRRLKFASDSVTLDGREMSATEAFKKIEEGVEYHFTLQRNAARVPGLPPFLGEPIVLKAERVTPDTVGRNDAPLCAA